MSETLDNEVSWLIGCDELCRRVEAVPYSEAAGGSADDDV
jgi:hypothetical protein